MGLDFLRREFITSIFGSPFLAIPAIADESGPANTICAAIETVHGGRIGLMARDMRTGRFITYRSRERFPMTSTHKILSAAAVLKQIDLGILGFDQMVRFSSADMIEYAPITSKYLAQGAMRVEDLCMAAVRWSDNPAGNLLLNLIGGPAGWTNYVRSLGDTISRLDRTEPALNTAIESDERDTSTPEAMLNNLHKVLFGDVLSVDGRIKLFEWMLNSPVTEKLMRSGIPKGWQVADKSGAGQNGTRNDLGVLLRDDGSRIELAIFQTGSSQPATARDKVISDLTMWVSSFFSR